MAPKRKARALAPAPPETRAVNARGQEFQAEKLTGSRAQRGNLPGGAPRWTYEVKWKGDKWKNTTFEPASCLVGWEASNRWQGWGGSEGYRVTGYPRVLKPCKGVNRGFIMVPEDEEHSNSVREHRRPVIHT